MSRDTAPRWIAAMQHMLGLPTPQVRRIRVDRNLAMTMRDGTVLLADRWCPADTQNAPVLLVRTPYGRSRIGGVLYGRSLAHQGFNVVMQSCRGTGGSGGTFDRPFDAEIEDGADTVAWLRRQPWYPGTFATMGSSYYGYTQLALAPAAEGELSGAVLCATPSSVRDIAWPEEAFSPGTAVRWAAMVTDDPAANMKHALTARRLDKRLRATAQDTNPLVESYRGVTGQAVPFLEEWMRAPEAGDPVWKRQDQHDALLALTCPVLIQASWYDVFLDSSLEQFRLLRDCGVDVRITIDSWAHGAGGIKMIPDAVRFLQEVTGITASSVGQHRVRLGELGSGTITYHDDWPDPDTAITWYAASARLLSTEPPSQSRTTWISDPADPAPSLGGRTLDAKAGPRDNAARERRSDVVTFDSDPVSAPLHVLGEMLVELTVSADQTATSLFVRVCDVDPAGHSINLADRFVRLLPESQGPDGTWHLSVRLSPVSTRVAPGNRLRLQISTDAFPHFSRQPADGVGMCLSVDFRRTVTTLHHGPVAPSSITIPIKG